MDTKNIDGSYRRVLALLEQERLQEALNLIKETMIMLSDWELHTRLEEVTTAYDYMLDYMEQGMNDPERARLHRELTGKSILLAGAIRNELLTANSDLLYYQTRRRKLRSIPIAEYCKKLESFSEETALASLIPDKEERARRMAQLEHNHEEGMNALFTEMWTAGLWNTTDSEEARAMLHSPMMPQGDVAVAVSGITLSLMEMFDPLKYLFLCEACSHEEAQLSQRALAGVFIATYLYDRELPFFCEAEARIKMLCEEEDFIKRMATMQIQFLRSRETAKIDRKMREEIIPAMMNNPNMLHNQKIELDLEKEMMEEEGNPEWEEWMDKTGIKDKLMEMTELQMEGADVYMTTFSQLKSFPFFLPVANWFRPFDLSQPDVAKVLPPETLKSNIIARTIFESPYFCDSDKYSFCLAMNQIPRAQRDAFISQMEEQGNAAGEDLSELGGSKLSAERKAEAIGNQYIQDLYRFYKLHPRHSDFDDLFLYPLNLQSCHTLSLVADSAQMLRLTGDYLMKKQYYHEAMEAYLKLSRKEEMREEEVASQAQLFQKMGYCRQKEGDIAGAIEAYHTSDLLRPGTLWNVRHLAQCYRILKQSSEALSYYMQAEEIEPDNVKCLLQTGECLMEAGDYEGAFARFFKVEYLESSPRAWRAIAWCSFITDKREQAEKYYGMLLEREKPAMQDFLNAGHVAWCGGNTERAVMLYDHALAMSKSSDDFFKAFDADGAILEEKGISHIDKVVMHDLLLKLM